MEYEFLLTAFYLSVLSYYLGTLFYMIPLPFYSIKKWAPTLMVDGVFSATLVFTYTIILALIDYIGGVLGSNWTSFYLWIGFKTGIVATLLTILRIIGMTLSMSGLQFLANSIISSLISILTYVILSLLIITVVAMIITSYGARLLALGILLHAVPFRLTRASGAMMISIVIVFSIGLPLMPAFVEYVSAPLIVPGLVVTDYGLAYVVVNITDTVGNSIPYTLFEAYRLDNNRLLARYIGSREGYIDTCDPDKGLPSSRSYGVVVEVGGARLVDTVNPVEDYKQLNNTVYRLDLRYNKLLSIGVTRFIYLNNSILKSLTISQNHYTLELDVDQETAIYIVVQTSDTVTVYIDGYGRSPDRTDYYTWYGVELYSHTYTLDTGSHVVDLYIVYGDTETPEIDEVYYLRDVANITLTRPITLINPIAYLIFNLLIAPLAYIAILFSTSYALARLLGGTRPSILYAVTMGRRIG